MSFQATNIFSVLKIDDTDENQQPQKDNKKTRREADKKVRENEGDYVNKNVAKGGKDRKPPAGRPAPREGKREYDRKSGTG
jgi:hypothetical protein